MAKKKIKEGYDRIELEKEKRTPTLSEEVANYDRKQTLKKVGKALTGVFAILLSLFLCWTVFGIVSFCWFDEIRQENATEDYTKIDDLFYSDGVASGEMFDKMRGFVDSLPQTVQDALNDDWAVIVADKVPDVLFTKTFAPTNQFDTSELVLAGYTFTQTHVIYINSSISDEDMYHAFVHEVGHMLSFEHGSIHGSVKWKGIFNENSRRFNIDEYSKSNEAEFFATMFDFYFTDEALIKGTAPNAYEYIENLLSTEIRDNNLWQVYTESYQNAIHILLSYGYETFRVV